MAESWAIIKDFYMREFGIDGWVVEMYANLDILALCVSGASNETIVNFLDLPLAEVIKVLSDAYEFEGWVKDLPFNPIQIFSNYSGTKSTVEHFVSFTSDVAVELGKYSGIEHIKPEKLFYMCELYNDIEERIRNEWI